MARACPERDNQGGRTALWKRLWQCSLSEEEGVFEPIGGITDSLPLWLIHTLSLELMASWDSPVTVTVCVTHELKQSEGKT